MGKNLRSGRQQERTAKNLTAAEVAKAAVRALDSKKALDIKVIGIRDLSILADYFVIATGTSSTHVKALADEVEYQLKEAGEAPGHVEGYRSNTWILLDYHNVIVHVFLEETRDFYDLERLWKDGEQIDAETFLQS